MIQSNLNRNLNHIQCRNLAHLDWNKSLLDRECILSIQMENIFQQSRLCMELSALFYSQKSLLDTEYTLLVVDLDCTNLLDTVWDLSNQEDNTSHLHTRNMVQYQ